MRTIVLSMLVSAAAIMVQRNANAQVPPQNSTFISVENYQHLDSFGDVVLYQVSGFAEPLASGITPKIFLLPRIIVNQDDIVYYGVDGTKIAPSLYKSQEIGSITITPKVLSGMPNSMQRVAIAGALKGQAVTEYLPPPLKNGANYVMTPVAMSYPPAASAVMLGVQSYESKVAEQNVLAAELNKYQPVSASLNQTEVQLSIGGVVVASRTYKGTATTLGPITLTNPTTFQKNQIIAGAFELAVLARFPDSSVASIKAKFNTNQAVDSFVEETQEAITKSKSSGFQVFNLGSRRSKMRTSLSSSIKSDDNVTAMDNTVIVMSDATDSMIDLFESQFFPNISRQNVINDHLAAAKEASTAGNLSLAKIHQDYATAIQQNNEMAEADSVGAAAALAAGDYATFIAKGVRSINSNDKREDSFRRVESHKGTYETNTNWDQIKQVSILRETTIPVTFDAPKRRIPRIGFCNMTANMPYVWVAPGPYAPNYINRTGLMVSCVQEGSPAASADLLPGNVIVTIGTKVLNSYADMETAMADFEPGDTIPFWVLQSPSPGNPHSTLKKIDVVSRRGWVAKSPPG